MATTYFKYAEKEADSYVNWGEIGKNMSDMLAEQNKLRQDKRDAIDKATQEAGQIVSQPPQGEDRNTNAWALKGADTLSKALLLQDNLLKSGQMDLRTYTINRQNLMDGAKTTYSLMEEYQAEFADKMKRRDNNESQFFEQWLMGGVEGFSNLQEHELVVSPTDYTLSVGKMIDDPSNLGGPKILDKNPNSFATVTSLSNRIKSKYNRFDVDKEVGAYVSTIGTEIKTLVDIKNKYQRGTITELLGQYDKSDLPTDAKGVVMKFEEAETKMLNSMLDEMGAASVLTDAVRFDPKTGERYDFTWDGSGNRSSNMILAKTDPNTGRPVAELTEDQRKIAIEHLRVQARLMYDKSEKVSVIAANEKPRATDAEIGRGIDLTTKQNLLDQWMKIYSASTAADKDAAADSLLGALKNYDMGITSVAANPNGNGVIVKWADGKEKPFEFKDKSGNIKSPDQWAAAGTTLHHLEDSKEYSKYKGSKFNNLTGTEWADVKAEYKMPAAKTNTDNVDPKQAWNSAIEENKNLISGFILSSEETTAASKLSEILSGSGFTVTESGAGNNLTITAPDGETEIEIGTNETSIQDRNNDAIKLTEWLKNNMPQERAFEWMNSRGGSSATPTESTEGVGSKYNG